MVYIFEIVPCNQRSWESFPPVQFTDFLPVKWTVMELEIINFPIEVIPIFSFPHNRCTEMVMIKLGGIAHLSTTPLRFFFGI